MNSNKNDFVKEDIQNVSFEEIQDHHFGNINFKKRKRKSKWIKIFLRGVIFVLIASLSGAATASFIVNKKIDELKLKESDKVLNGIVGVSNEDYSINKVAEKVGPAVVGITSISDNELMEQNSVGSGIIFESNGYIVTNYHVIEELEKVYVKLPNGRDAILAKVIGVDSISDLAVIKIDVGNLPAAKLGDSTSVKVGDTAIAIGNPLGEKFAGTVTAGIISATDRKIRLQDTVYNVIQTDAAINPGNSGGALCNIKGEIIGINSLKVSNVLNNTEGMGFAIKINEAKKIIDELMESGRVSRPRMGIRCRTALRSDSEEVRGVYVADVMEGSGADAAHINVGDIIVEFDESIVVKFDDLISIVESHNIGDKVSCKIWRDKEYIDVEVELKDFKEE
ncbi:trypsin-like peptidase domain-containing protein [Clostridium sediminicola]|uniref:S1C family serine protease n=1 Tax=Clostridium sediminicola TaxID=3114879 RepID=UPI0031F25813